MKTLETGRSVLVKLLFITCFLLAIIVMGVLLTMHPELAHTVAC